MHSRDPTSSYIEIKYESCYENSILEFFVHSLVIHLEPEKLDAVVIGICRGLGKTFKMSVRAPPRFCQPNFLVRLAF